MLLSQTDQLGRTTKHVYDANRNEVKRTNALGEVTTYTYDANGNQTSSTNAARRGDHDDLQRVLGEPLTTTNPIGNTTTIAYDANGLPTSFTDSMGLLATFTSIRARAAAHGDRRRGEHRLPQLRRLRRPDAEDGPPRTNDTNTPTRASGRSRP